MQSHVTRDKSGKKQSSSLSNKISKEKTNFNKKFEKINNHSKTFKFMFNNNNDSINKNSKNSFRINNLKKTKKLNSRNILNYNSNIYSFQYMNNNIKTINEINKKNKIKNKNTLKNETLDKYKTANHSPNDSLDKKELFSFYNISKIIYENTKMKEKNENLSIQINDMTKEFENMKKENIIIKNELKEKAKMIKLLKI
jgi:hypothetical protein